MQGHIECVTFQPREGVDMAGWERAVEGLATEHGCLVLESEYDFRQGRGYFIYAYPGPRVETGPIAHHWKPGGMYLSIHPIPLLVPARPILRKLVYEELPEDFIK